jgi:UDP-glucose 4-epimerase
MSGKSILVTGGAGYIGSHVVRQLGDRGESIVVLDDLSTGFAQAVLSGELIVGNTADAECLCRIFEGHEIDTVMHFAARTIVPESVADPLRYYGNNTCASRTLLDACVRYSVKHFVFSSTAAVYGIPETGVASEETPTNPINPYGMSKLMTETMLSDVTKAYGMQHIVLRYFNVAGCDPGGRIGQSTREATLLTKVACEAAVGKRDAVRIFGNDYETPDGTGIRDYIHVEDLADAHLRALDHLRDGGESATLNCGYGRGYSVLEVIDAVEKVAGSPIRRIESPRRAGDPPILIAEADRIRSVLDWKPRFDNLETIAESGLRWERKLLGQPYLTGDEAH